MNILTMIGKAIWDLLRAIFGSLGVLLNSLFGGFFKPLWESFRQVFRFNSEEIKRPLLVLVSALVIICSLVSIFLTLRTPTVEINLKPFEGLGTALAEETVKLLGGRGDIVVLGLKLETESPVASVPLETFRKSLKAHPQLTIRETETVSPSLEAMYGPVSPLTIDQIIQLIQKHQFADAIVTFVELPPLSDEDWEKLPKRRPKIICAGSYSPQLRQLFEKNIVQLAVSPRFQAANETREPVTSREWFDRYYVVVTADNLSVLPDSGRSPRNKSAQMRPLSLLILLSLTACGPSDYTNAPPPAGRPWVAFGDSLTAGTGAREEYAYPALLGQRLGIEILNHGMPGDTTATGLARLDDILAANPSVVLLCLGGNDGLQRVALEDTLANLSTIITRLQERGVFVVLIGVRSASLLDQYDKPFRRLARQMRALYIPNILDGLLAKPQLMADQIHPNATGYAVIAERLEKELRAAGIVPH